MKNCLKVQDNIINIRSKQRIISAEYSPLDKIVNFFLQEMILKNVKKFQSRMKKNDTKYNIGINVSFKWYLLILEIT